jgi:hypothetical protein
MPGTPIKLTLYDADDQMIKELCRTVVPWGLLKRAIRLSRGIDPDNLKEEDVDAMAGLVLAIFGDKVTLKELDDNADTTDMMTVMTQIVAKAENLMPNPPIPATKPGKQPRVKVSRKR